MPDSASRGDKLQIMLSRDELAALDNWRFQKHMPSRAAAVRELLKRGLAGEGFLLARAGVSSSEYGVLTEKNSADNDSNAPDAMENHSQKKSG
jgi:hypothetical protein